MMERTIVRRTFGAKAPLRQTLVASPFQQQRSFSQTSPHNQAQPPHIVFDNDVSPNLKPLLDQVQTSIILPSYLPGRQRKRIFDKDSIHSLRVDPIVIEIDGISHRFDHIDRDSRPDTRVSMRNILREMQTDKDWSNFIRLLSGLRHANRKLNTSDAVKIIRQVGSQGRIFDVIDAARQVRKTGFKIDYQQKVHEILLFTQLKALNAGWEKAETAQALKWSRLVLDMAAHPNHKADNPGRPAWLDDFPLERDPLALAAPLHLSAALAVGHQGGADVNGDVASWAKQLLAAWPSGKGLLEIWPEDAYSSRRHLCGLHYLTSAPAYLPKASMALHGLKLAQRVVSPVLAEQLKAISDPLEAELAQQVGKLSEGLQPDTLPHLVQTSLFDANGEPKLEVREARGDDAGPTVEGQQQQ